MKKRLFLILALIIGLGLGCQTMTVAAAEKFSDVPDGIWYAAYVDNMVDHGFISGVGNNCFAPEEKIQRAEFAKLLAAASGDDVTIYCEKQRFHDVPVGQWYTPYVNWAADNGIVQGKGDGIFEPYANITRQEMMTMMNRFTVQQRINLPKVRVTRNFTDENEISAWARNGVTAMTRAAVLDGYKDGSFRPNASATRAETAKIVSVFLERVNGYDGPTEVLVLLYHNLTDNQKEASAQPYYNTTAKKFEQDLTTLLNLGLKPLSLEDYYRGNYDRGRDHFVVTFDDGYLSNYTLAFPVLQRLRVYGDIFICTGFSNLSNHFNYEQAATMEASGYVKIYSHTPYHNKATSCTPEEFRALMESSFAAIETNLGHDRYRIFAYPGGTYNDQTHTALQEMGTVLQMVQDLSTPRKGDLVNRISVTYNTNIQTLAEKFFHTSF